MIKGKVWWCLSIRVTTLSQCQVTPRRFMASKLNVSPLVLPAKKAHSGSVIFLHGLGDTGHGWLDGVELFQKFNPHLKFICPHASPKPITINFGMSMPAWYDIATLDGSGTEDLKGLEESRAVVNELIAQEVKQGIPHERIIVGGFSQGAVVSIFTVYQHPVKLAGCVALSGYLAMASTFKEHINPANAQTPLLMYHGEADTVVSFEFGKRSYEFLRKMDINVKFKPVPRMPHTALPEELVEVANFIREKIPE